MCGRYSFYPDKTFSFRFGLNLIPSDLAKIKPNTNVTPGQIMPIITKSKKSNQLNFLTWGFLPTWAKSSFRPLINARSETLLNKPFFKDAFLKNRCLIPATGFYEWQKKQKLTTPPVIATNPIVIARNKVTKQSPFYFSLKDDSIFSFAGLYNPVGYTIITTSPNDLVKPIHHRMPVILSQADESIWLDPKTDPNTLANLLSPFLKDHMSSIQKHPN